MGFEFFIHTGSQITTAVWYINRNWIHFLKRNFLDRMGGKFSNRSSKLNEILFKFLPSISNLKFYKSVILFGSHSFTIFLFNSCKVNNCSDHSQQTHHNIHCFWKLVLESVECNSMWRSNSLCQLAKCSTDLPKLASIHLFLE